MPLNQEINLNSQIEILLVDDQRGNQMLLERVLSRDDYQVTCKSSGLEALDYLEDHVPDLLLLDVVMPVMDGLEVLKCIRRNHTPLDLPVIMVTARTEGAHIAKALELGANDYITKPVDLRIAQARIRNQIKLKTWEKNILLHAKRFELAIQGSAAGLWDWDLEADQIYFSPRWKAILGFQEHEIGNSPGEWFERIHGEDRDMVAQRIEQHLKGKSSAFDAVYRMSHRDGSNIWVASRGAALVRRDGVPYRLSGSHTNITQIIAVDRHTGLYSGYFFKDRLSRLADDKAAKGGEHAVLALGLDQFDWLRDSLDSIQRHELLAEVGRRLQAAAGEKYLLSRFHTDRFLVLHEGPDRSEEVMELAAMLQAAFSRPFILEGTELFLSPAIGIAWFDGAEPSPDMVLRDAFAAMAEAKREGKEKIRIFEKRIRIKACSILALETDLRNALRNREFLLHYQPIVSLEDGKVSYCEALIRWHHPQKGMLFPAAFIQAAEQMGLIGEIGEWVLREVCSQINRWQQEGWPLIPVTVNFANFQFQQEGILELIQKILEESKLDARMLKIELTESVLIRDLAHNAHLLNQLRSQGIQILLDDFGTGYSSLSYLKHLPIDVLKIDQSFISETVKDKADDALVMAIIQMARGLGMQTVCEGVERHDQVAMLMAMGCDFAQGFYFGKPLPGNEFTGYLSAKKSA